MDDPKAYTKPWVNPPKLYKMEPGWEIGEWFCVVDESNTYDRVVRKAAGVAPKWKPASVLLPPRRVLKITRARCRSITRLAFANPFFPHCGSVFRRSSGGTFFSCPACVLGLASGVGRCCSLCCSVGLAGCSPGLGGAGLGEGVEGLAFLGGCGCGAGCGGGALRSLGAGGGDGRAGGGVGRAAGGAAARGAGCVGSTAFLGGSFGVAGIRRGCDVAGGAAPGFAAGPSGRVVLRGGSLGAPVAGAVGRPGAVSAGRFGCERAGAG